MPNLSNILNAINNIFPVLADEAEAAVYIALNDIENEGTFIWEDGSPVS